MKIIKGNNISEVYDKALKALQKAKIVNNTREINNACLIIKHPSLKNIYFPNRKISEKYSNAELKWYWSGDNSCETIGQYAKMWLSLTDDGKTNNSAYGYILEKKYGFDQIQQIIELLKKDPYSRRAILNISDPTLNRITTHDLQCTIAIQFLIRNKKLEMTVYMRSNDIYFGTPYDWIYFISIAEYIAKKLKLKLGTYTHHATSLHMYLRDEDKFLPHEQITNINLEKIWEENYEI